MGKDASREVFGFTRGVIGSTRGCTIVDKFIVMFLECIMTPLFVFLDMFVVVSFVTRMTAQASSWLL